MIYRGGFRQSVSTFLTGLLIIVVWIAIIAFAWSACHH